MQVGAITWRDCKAQRLDRLKQNTRIGPRHPRLAGIGFRVARWLAAKTMGAAGFHQLGSEFADARIAHVREKLARGETVYLAGLGAPGTHNSGRGAGRGDAGERAAADRQQRGRALFRQQAHDRISANCRSTRWWRRCARWAATSAISMPGSPAGIIRRWPARWRARCSRNCRRVSSSCAPPKPPASTAAASTR